MTGKWQSPKESNEQSAADPADASFLKDLKISFSPWESEADAPKIDQDFIRTVIEDRGTDAESAVVQNLMLRFRSWADAYLDEAEIWRANRASPDLKEKPARDYQSAGDRAAAILWNGLNLPVRPWEPEANAPKIDLNLIWQVIKNRGTDWEEAVVVNLMLRFRSWADAYVEQAKIWESNGASPNLKEEPAGDNQTAADRAATRFWNDLNLPVRPWEPEANAPKIDLNFIRKIIEDRGTDEEQKLIMSLLLRFRSWAEAYIKRAEIWKANRASPNHAKEPGNTQAVDYGADEL